MKMWPDEEGNIVVDEVYGRSIVFHCDLGDFAVCQRDGGIVIMDKGIGTFYPQIRQEVDKLATFIMTNYQQAHLNGEFMEGDTPVDMAIRLLSTNILIPKEREGPIPIDALCLVHKVKVFQDGSSWCAMIGENLAEGFAGFGGDIPEALTNLASDVKAAQNQFSEWIRGEAKAFLERNKEVLGKVEIMHHAIEERDLESEYGDMQHKAEEERRGPGPDKEE